MAVTAQQTWPDPAVWTGKIYSGGWRTPRGGAFRVVEPATGGPLAEVGAAAPEDVVRAAEEAAAAQRSWAATAPQERAQVLLRAAGALSDREDVVREWIVRETGGVPVKG